MMLVPLDSERGGIGGASQEARAAFFTGRDACATEEFRAACFTGGDGCATGMGKRGAKRFSAVVRLLALHLSLRAPLARVDLPLDKGRLLGGSGRRWSAGGAGSITAI